MQHIDYASRILEPHFQPEPGSYVMSMREGFRYFVLPRDAENASLVNQSNGTKFEVLPTPEGVYNWESMLPFDDGVTCNHSKMMHLIEKDTFDRLPEYPSARKIIVPGGGVYRFSKTIEAKRVINIEGYSSGMPYNSTASFVFDPGIDGIRINRHDTLELSSVDRTTGADGSVIKGLNLFGETADTTLEHIDISDVRRVVQTDGGYIPGREAVYLDGKLQLRGLDYEAVDNLTIHFFEPLNPGQTVSVNPFAGRGIHLRARAVIERCYLRGFEGNGVEVLAFAGSQGLARGNANCFHMIGGRVENCGMHGVYVQGADANAGYLEGVDCSFNKGYGVYDASLLGNTQVASHGQGNELGDYRVDNGQRDRNSNQNSRSVLLGAYSEQGGSGSHFEGQCGVLGGIAGSGFTKGGQVRFFDGGDIKGGAITASNATVSVTLAGDERNKDLVRFDMLEVNTPDGVVKDPTPFRIKVDRHNSITGTYGNSESHSSEFAITTDFTRETFNTGEKQPGTMMFPKGYALGRNQLIKP